MSAAIPENTVTVADLAEWYRLHEELGRIKSAEALLRGRIFKHFFPAPKEGTNNAPLQDGTGAVLKGQHVINRSVDQGALDALRKAQSEAIERAKADGSGAPNIPLLKLDELVKYKPEVSITKYRELTEEERHHFDQCLVIKPGSPQLEIVIPKRPVKG